MGISQARKHGKYLGGRSWPKVCPTCRMCGLGPPIAYYNARGLCNVCHKDIRETGGREALEEYEQLPSEADDRSLERLYKDPARWLQKYMGGPYTQPFIAAGPSSVMQEATRIFASVVDRWYGREATPSIQYAPDLPTHEVAWSTSASAPVTSTHSRGGRVAYRDFHQRLEDELLSFARRAAPRLQVPGTFVSGDEYAVIWISKEVSVSVAVWGEVDQETGLISLVEERANSDFDFNYDQLGHMLRCLSP